VFFLISNSTNTVCEKYTWRPKIPRWIPGGQFGRSAKPESHTPDLGEAWPNVRSRDIHKAGPPERLAPCQNHRRRWIEACIRDPLWPVRIPSHVHQMDYRTSHIRDLHWRLRTALHWRLCHMLPRRHPDQLDQWEGTRRSRTKSATATMPIRPLLLTQNAPIWRL